ncbi:hypothetical protein N181_09820 [Sinorhizobium fredii USDA 205]|uniref:Uncharacterized protein n=1 Tax=Rhizobium fredii TaxID=380 RepID=A0A844A956_RHIFR|nr:hypothetical protein [Sinorhizobium fredii]KSV90954.1 hypothetical protein N181_09820 [Sinorhizobium fredii USDA 205]MQX08648.1 hypothetical protein [Sinorhizobium fredii]GEC30515.1 hypothetical protein EFR01_06860 [Sinorhizobium fredii]GLS09712.1 hypothetical protein GCM10007864_33430 [Sinorhizobium fredii]
MSSTDLSQMRAEAGQRYAAAVAELRAAYVDLAGIEAAINNGGVPVHPVATFRGDADRIPWEFRHPSFYPESGDSLRDAWAARRDHLIADQAKVG